MMEQWKWSAHHLLYVCKTYLLYFAKFRPLANDAPPSASGVTGLDPSQVAYVRYLIESRGLASTPLPLSRKLTDSINALF